MPADTSPPFQPQPASAGGQAGAHANASQGDEHALIGYECALPWLQPAPPAMDPVQPPWPGATAD